LSALFALAADGSPGILPWDIPWWIPEYAVFFGVFFLTLLVLAALAGLVVLKSLYETLVEYEG
jgi:hypothetical protein